MRKDSVENVAANNYSIILQLQYNGHPSDHFQRVRDIYFYGLLAARRGTLGMVPFGPFSPPY